MPVDEPERLEGVGRTSHRLVTGAGEAGDVAGAHRQVPVEERERGRDLPRAPGHVAHEELEHRDMLQPAQRLDR